VSSSTPADSWSIHAAWCLSPATGLKQLSSSTLWTAAKQHADVLQRHHCSNMLPAVLRALLLDASQVTGIWKNTALLHTTVTCFRGHLVSHIAGIATSCLSRQPSSVSMILHDYDIPPQHAAAAHTAALCSAAVA